MNGNPQDDDVQRQIEREVRMREGAGKLLAACSRREQALEAAKSLLTCNARILALLRQLQRRRKARILQSVGRSSSEDVAPCLGKLALSDLRIPLMWKDSEYFKNKGELQRCAVFCLLQCGTEIHDTDLVMVDRTLTDICFEDTIIFNEAAPGFQLGVELYSSCVVEEFSPGPLGPRRVSCLGASLGRSSGKKIRAAFESATVCGSVSAGVDAGPGPALPPFGTALGPKYSLLAHASLGLEHVQEGFKTHDFSLAATEDAPFWLPLYGNMCCRLAAQPLCLTQPVISGQLTVVKLGDDLNCRCNVFGVLKGQNLLCYQRREDLESADEPLLAIPITKDTRVSVSEGDPARGQSVNIATEDATYRLVWQTPEDSQRWTDALWGHISDLGRWKQCCDRLMRIDPLNPRRPPTVRQGSLYHEIVTPPTPREGVVVPDLSVEIRTLLSSYYKESY